MISPDKVHAEATKKEKENLRFGSYLKMNADEDVLDQQFLDLHNELYADYDCSKCRNCCKEYSGVIPEEDIPTDASKLGISEDQFKKFFLEWDRSEAQYVTRHQPCDFLQDDGECMLGDCKPDSCKEYPYTDQPERLYSMTNMLANVSVCPVVFEIFERLKKAYHFSI